MTHTGIAQIFIANKISDALTRAGLPHNHAIRPLLERNAEIVGTRDPYFVVIRTDNGTISLDEQIEQLRSDPRYSTTFPPPTPTVVKTDIETIKNNFDAVAAGHTLVV